MHLPPYRVLSREEEAGLLRAAKTGCVKSRNEIVSAFMPFVASMAAKIVRPTSDRYEDLVQDGMFALIGRLGLGHSVPACVRVARAGRRRAQAHPSNLPELAGASRRVTA